MSVKSLSECKNDLISFKKRKTGSVVSENISVCSTELKKLGKLVYRSKIPFPKNEEEFQKTLQFASSLSVTQRNLINTLLNINSTCSSNTFINELGYEEEKPSDSLTLVSEEMSEEEEDDDDDSFIENSESEE